MEGNKSSFHALSSSNTNYLDTIKSIRVVRNDAYNVLSVLRSYVNNISGYSATSNLVPILGADATVLKTNEQKLIKKFRKLLVSLEYDETKYLEIAHLEPFFNVFKTFDSRHIKLLLINIDVLTNLAKSDLLCFEEEQAYDSINKLFGEVLSLFGNAVEIKEDFLLFKAFDCLASIYESYYGNLVNNENTCNMIKRFLSLMSNRNKNSFFKKVMYTKVYQVLLNAFGNKYKYPSHQTDLYRRVNSLYLFLSLVTGLTNRYNFIGYHMEDTYLYISDRDTLMSLRSHLNPILVTLVNNPTHLNEFTEEMKRMGLGLIINSLEWNLVDLSNVNVVPIVQSHVTHSIYKLIFTDSITMYSLVLRGLKNLFINFRYYLKSQMELFLNHLISSVMNHVVANKKARLDIVEMNMEFLGELAKNTDLLLEVYLNFDCDVKCSNLFDTFVKCLLTCISSYESEYTNQKSDQVKNKKLTQKSTLKRATQPYKANSGTSETIPQINTEFFALNTIQNIIKYMLTQHKLYINNNPNHCSNYQNSQTEYDKLKEKAYKNKLLECSTVFNEAKSDEWIKKATELGIFSKNYTEKEVAVFLKYAPQLDLTKLGEYLATHKNPEFMDKVRSIFCELNNFAGMPMIKALRLFLSSFMLPREAQQIDRLLESFSKVYFSSQPLVAQTDENLTYDPNTNEKDQLKMPRWVIQEEFYHKYKPIHQHSNQSGLTAVNLQNINDSNSEFLLDFMKYNELRDVNNWKNNMDMFNYFLSDDSEGMVSIDNYLKICEYLKNTPITMETQTTYNESIPSLSPAELEALNQEGGTNRSSKNADSPKNSNTSNAGTPVNALDSSAEDQSPLSASDKIRTESKSGFAYIQDYDTVFVLCFSAIILNTDLYNTQVKNKMKLEDFIRNNRGTNGGKYLSTEFFRDLYNSIKYHEIKLHASDSIDTTKYEPYLWSDHVLQRQGQMSPYVQLTRHKDEETADDQTRRQRVAENIVAGATEGSSHLKLKLLVVMLDNRLLEVLDNLFCSCRTMEMLKKIVELFWLLVRVGLKHENYELVNSVFQLPGIDVCYSLGNKCQISISFILNVIAVASEHFDKKSWTKSLDIITRLYCLNLLPATFGALDSDNRLFHDYWNDLTVPSIKFKRLTDRRSSNWLVGLSSLMPFTKGATNPENVKSTKKDSDGECDETFLFLFDVQVSTKDLLQNKFFDVYLLRNRFSPIYSSEDESTINNVTKTLSSEADREELLPPILTYINLRLAFLNIYKLDDLFLGTIINTDMDSFKLFLSVITNNIFHPKLIDKDAVGDKDSYREADNFGNILDPNHMELNRFRNKILSIFNLGIFSRLSLQILTSSNKHLKTGSDFSLHNDKRALMLKCFIEVFYNLSKKMVVTSSLEFLPSKQELYSSFNVTGVQEEYVVKESERMEDVFKNYVAFILLSLVLWFVDYFNNHKDMESPTSRSRQLDKLNRLAGNDSNSLGNNGDLSPNRGDTVYYDLIDLSTWLLHLFINFDNKIFSSYLDPLEKLLYNLADSVCISHNTYMVTVVMCSIQRMVNPYLPFGTEPFKKSASRNGSPILTLLLKRSKCLSLNNEYVARLTAQTLLSIGLFSSKPNAPRKTQTTPNQPKQPPPNTIVKDQFEENLLAIQLLIEFNSFAGDGNDDNLEHLWLLSLHSLSILFSIGPHEISNEAIKGLNKLLLQQQYPESKCSFTSQVSRIFDYVLAPMLTHNFCYPLPKRIQTPLNESQDVSSPSNKNYVLSNPFQNPSDYSDTGNLWMAKFLGDYMNNYAFSDYNDLASRKASATNLVCHALLSKLNDLMTDKQEDVPAEVLKSSASNLECLLYDKTDVCDQNCVKRLLVFTQYVLNVIIPSNGEIHTGISRDTYLEALKNFILVLLTSPELKCAPESCKNHFKNDKELTVCLESLKEQVSFTEITSGEYVLSSLLAHTFSSSDSLKNLFFDVLRVVFPNLEPEPSAS